MAVRRRRWRPDFGSCLIALAVVAASTWMIVHAVTAWITGHPGVVGFVILVAALGGVGGSRISGRAVGRRVDRVATEREFQALTPGEFEHAVADLCRRDGCSRVEVVGGAGDLAADVLAALPDGRRVLVQCKRYAAGTRVGSPDVQQVGGTYAVVHRADLAIVVTTSTFTAAARSYARTAGIVLVDGQQLAAWGAQSSRPPWA